MAVSSYGAATKTSGVVRILKDLDHELEGRDVLLVEDIVDSGLTLKYLLKNLAARKPASLEVAALLRKQGIQQVELDLRYVGFDIPNEFVVGLRPRLRGEVSEPPVRGDAPARRPTAAPDPARREPSQSAGPSNERCADPSCAAALLLLAACAHTPGDGPSPMPGSGARGTVVFGPNCPVVVAGSPCPGPTVAGQGAGVHRRRRVRARDDHGPPRYVRAAARPGHVRPHPADARRPAHREDATRDGDRRQLRLGDSYRWTPASAEPGRPCPDPVLPSETAWRASVRPARVSLKPTPPARTHSSTPTGARSEQHATGLAAQALRPCPHHLDRGRDTSVLADPHVRGALDLVQGAEVLRVRAGTLQRRRQDGADLGGRPQGRRGAAGRHEVLGRVHGGVCRRAPDAARQGRTCPTARTPRSRTS